MRIRSSEIRNARLELGGFPYFKKNPLRFYEIHIPGNSKGKGIQIVERINLDQSSKETKNSREGCRGYVFMGRVRISHIPGVGSWY